MEYNDTLRSATDLTGLARGTADVLNAQYALDAYLPPVENYGLTYEFSLQAIGLNEKAFYRGFNTPALRGSFSDSSTTRVGKLPPISIKYSVEELAQLKLMGLTDAMGAKLEQFANKGATAITDRVALARAEAIVTGKLVIEKYGTIDFARAAGHSVTMATLLSDPSAQVIDVLASYRATYAFNNDGSYPEVALLSQRILDALMKNTQVIQLAVGRGTDLPTRVGTSDVQSVFSNYLNLSIVVKDEKTVGSKERLIADHKIILLPASGLSILGVESGVGRLGTTQWGIPAESLNDKYGISDSDRPGIFAAAFDDNDPEGTTVLVSAIVIPAVENANATFEINALAAA